MTLSSSFNEAYAILHHSIMTFCENPQFKFLVFHPLLKKLTLFRLFYFSQSIQLANGSDMPFEGNKKLHTMLLLLLN